MASSSSSSRATMADPPFLNFYPKDASLYGVEFAARCPPDVSPRTRIVAVCGIINIGGLASPALDGWFLSDFWMFNHLLRHAPVTNQIWLTCCNPKLLVEQYSKYAHGNPFQERRIVLEERLLDNIREAGALRVVEPKVLLERFLKTVGDECREAAKADQDVLLLVFGHGDGDSYGVTIGSHSNTEFREIPAPRLQINRLKGAIGKKTKCTLLMTSCYSGGWAMKPDLNLTLKSKISGSIVASAIRDAILASEIKDEENLGKPGMTYGELRTTETYAEMGCLIYDHLKESDYFYDQHKISFAAQEDEWTRAWRERTGIPLAFFKEKWEELSVIPAQAESFTNRDLSSRSTGSFALENLSLSETRFGSTIPSMPTKTMPQMYTMIRALAAGYAKSNPGPDNVSINMAFHTTVRELLSGKDKYENRMDALLTLGHTLNYRLEGMTMATYYKDFLGLDYPECASCSVEAWSYPLYKEQGGREKLAIYWEIKNMIHDVRIFSAASNGQGYDYDKPEGYLAIALVESRKNRNEVEQAISVLKDLHTAILAPKVEGIRRGRWFLDKADRILRPIRKTLRSISPRKRKSITLSD